MAHRSVSRRGRQVDHAEEHESHERWLVTYADMITLLMVLFIVLFAMSQVDQRKFNELRVGLAAGFGQSTSILDGSQSLLSEPGQSEVQPIAPPTYTDVVPQINAVTGNPQVDQQVKTLADQQLQQANQQNYAEALAEAKYLRRLNYRLISALARRGYKNDVRTVIDGRGLVISLISNHVVFPNNLASLTPRGIRVLNVVAPVLAKSQAELSIEGNTNQVKVAPKYYPTDWELSAARAATVLRYLNEHKGIPNNRLELAAWGHTKPLVDPSKPGSQELNKRVDIIVRSNLTGESAGMLAQAAQDLASRPSAAQGQTSVQTSNSQ
jgi:chemotaxis protein MotB